MNGLIAWIAALSPLKKTLLGVATTAFLIELALRNGAPKSKVYASWTRGLMAVGAFWTAVILSIVYFVSVALVSIGMRLVGKDLLDRRIAAGVSAWHSHDPNPLGPYAAARHQF